MIKERVKENVYPKGFSRIQIEEDGRIVGDSGYVGPNAITNEGFDDYLCRLLAAQASSKQARYLALGSGTAPNVTHSTLNGEIMGSTQRKVATVSVSASKTVRFTATFYSSDSFLTGASNLRNLGLYESNATNNILFAGQTYGSSSCNTNQNVGLFGVGQKQFCLVNLSKTGKPLFVIKRGNPVSSPQLWEDVETGRQAPILWGEGTVQTTNTIH